MVKNEMLSTWELFLGEITRNINPSKNEIENNLAFLKSSNVCSDTCFDALVSVRYMAAFEQAINVTWSSKIGHIS